jgi:hypothetical protein
MPTGPSTKLSRAQRVLLRDLLRYSQGEESILVPVRWLRGSRQGWSSAESASFSRSLRRLEGRGLIIRTNQSTGIRADASLGGGRVRTCLDEPYDNRTDHIILTDLGRQVAETVK